MKRLRERMVGKHPGERILMTLMGVALIAMLFWAGAQLVWVLYDTYLILTKGV